MLPSHISGLLKVPVDADEDSFVTALEQFTETANPWFLNLADGCRELATAFHSRPGFSTEIVDIEHPASEWGFASLASTAWLCSAVCIPQSGGAAAATGLSSDGLRVLARAWWTRPELLQPSDNPSDPPQSLRGKAILVCDPRCTLQARELVIALSGSVRKQRCAPPPIGWLARSAFTTSETSLSLHEKMLAGQLLQRALSETSPRWRFLNLYRIFESAYLLNLQSAFSSGFLEDPKKTVDEIRSALESELGTFSTLVDNAGLKADFEVIRGAVHADRGNRFLWALKNRKGSETAWQQGVQYIYQARCSIVHAGQHAPVYERYVDADAAICTLLPHVEDATFRLLGIA